jgi:U3 small nucleolar RNA-associated protein 21
VCITACGHFALLGGSAGTVCAFNLQSGGRRGVFPTDKSISSAYAAKGKIRRHGAMQANPGGRTDEGVGFPADRDTGRGEGDIGARNYMLGKVDSVDTTLALAAGIAPPQSRMAAAAAVAGAAAAAAAAASSRVPAGLSTLGAQAASSVETVSRHAAAVYGVATDLLNSVAVSVDAAGVVLFWDFATHALLSSLELPAPASALLLSRSSGLGAIACDDFSVRVVDVSTRRQVRSFSGHSNRISDMCFSPDGRWLVSASLDRSIRVWDLPTARCLDWMTFQLAPISVTFSPTSEYLVTAHADSLGLCMWANKAHFGGAVLEGVAPTAPANMSLPRSSRDTAADGPSALEPDAPVFDQGGADVYVSGDDSLSPGADEVMPGSASGGSSEPQLAICEAGDAGEAKAGCRITMSGLPQAAWANLGRLDHILARNRPIEPPKKPEAAPFFLPTAAGLNPTFVAPSGSTSASTRVQSSADAKDADELEPNGHDDDEAWAGPVAATMHTSLESAPAFATSRLVVSPPSASAHVGRTARTVLASLLRGFEQSREAAEAASEASSAAATGMGARTLAAAAALSASKLDEASGAVSSHLASLAQFAVDVEIRSLALGSAEDSDGVLLLGSLLRYFSHELRRRSVRRFELIQAHLSLTLAVHGALCAEVPVLRAIASDLRRAQLQDAVILSDTLDKGLSLVALALGH